MLLEVRGRVVVKPGFDRVLPPASAADEPPAVPDVAAGAAWGPGSVSPEVSSSWTKPPPRYTEASLVAELESAGVGRPSTYANTLKTLVDRNYVLLDGRVFVVTPLGRLVSATLRRHFGRVTDVGFTAGLEKQLDELASGRGGMRPLLDGFYGELRGELDGAEVDPSFAPPKPALVDRPCPRFGEGSAVLIEAGRLVVACRMCPDPAELTVGAEEGPAAPGEVRVRPRRPRPSRGRLTSGCRRVAPAPWRSRRLNRIPIQFDHFFAAR